MSEDKLHRVMIRGVRYSYQDIPAKDKRTARRIANDDMHNWDKWIELDTEWEGITLVRVM